MKIKYQVVILVAAILAVEFTLIECMTYLLDEAEKEATSLEERKEVIATSGDYVSDVYEVYRLLSGSGKEEHAVWLSNLNASLAAMRFHSNWLLSHAKDETSLLAGLKTVNEEEDNTLTLYNQINALPEQTREMTRLSPRFREHMDNFLESLAKFSREQRRLRISESSLQRRWRLKFRENLFLAFVVNTVAAAIVVTLLIRNIVLRLNVLVENVFRVKYKKPLVAPVTGNDEIAELDSAFRDMHGSLVREQEALVASEKRIRHLIGEVPVGLMSISQDGTVEFCNAPLSKMFRHSLGDIEGNHVSSFFATGGMSEGTFWEQLQEKAISRVIELFAIDETGEQFLVELMLSEPEKGGSLFASVTNIQDKYKLMKLRQEFVAMISHELRTPLTSLSGVLTLSLSGAFGDLSDDFVKQLSQSHQSINRLIALVNELLDLEKMDSGTVLVSKAPCQLERIFDQVLNSISIFAQTLGVKIVMPINCKLEIVADADRLTQVLVNLISNALVVSLQGGNIVVTCEEKKDHILFSVTDEGPGIPEEFQEIIFERWQQVTSTGKEKKSGTGLGLAICKSIVEQHSGQIGVKSELGKGTTFWFTIPYKDDEE